MKYFFLLFVFSYSANATIVPKTVEEAVMMVLFNLNKQDEINLVLTDKLNLSRFNRSLGAGIRNDFQLWDRKSDLLNNCGMKNKTPESCSEKVIMEVWLKLKHKYMNSPLNKTFKIIKTTPIPPYNEKDKGLSSFVQFINNNLNTNELVIKMVCEDSHYRNQNYFNTYRNSRVTYLNDDLRYLAASGIANITIEENEILLTPLPFLNSPICEIKNKRGR